MFRPLSPEASERRRAVILIVVLVLLTLFAIVGLAFVLYANMEADSSRIYRESITSNGIDIDVLTLTSYPLGQLLFDLPDPTNAAGPSPTSSAMRGHSLARDMYGWNQDIPGSSINAFNGVGRMHTTLGNPPPWGADDHALLSYVPYPADGFVRDPERLGMRANLGAALPPYTGGWNSSYTYPDGNHVFLGAFDADGNVVARSFVRPYLVPQTVGVPHLPTDPRCLPLDPSSPTYWTWFTDTNPSNAAETVPPGLRYYSLRPRNKDMAAGFPFPQLGGDVKNLQGFPGGMDSVWMDLDYPVQTAPDGVTQYKPLFAFFVADLEGRVNVNTHGNVRSTAATHLSDQGWGKWEVNPAWLSTPLGNAVPTSGEWPQLLIGSAGPPAVAGRYGADQQPSASGTVSPAGTLARVNGQVDLDGSDDSGPGNVGGVATGPLVLPGDPTAAAYASFPFFPKGYNNGFAAERTNHAGIYDSQYPGGDDRRFNANQHLLEFYHGGPASTAALGTDMGRLAPNTFGASLPGFRARNMLTTDSVAVEIPGLTPWIYDRSKNAYGYGAAAAGLQTVANQAPTGPAVAFPAVALRPVPPNVPPPSTEFTIDWKSVDAVLGKVDLNRFLPPYPHLGQGTTTATYSSVPLTTSYARFDDGGPLQAQWNLAQQARQQLADDIYRRLLRVTGVPPVAPANVTAPTATDLAPRRWLAQLAVNIVDFIDEDEISTPFNFYNSVPVANGGDGLPAANVGDVTAIPASSNAAATELPKYWVFGTELPKVVVNEVLAEYTPDAVNGNQFNVNVFAELFNPMPSAAQLGGAFPGTVQQQDNPANPIPLFIPAAGPKVGYSPYQVVLADSTRDVTAVPILNGLLPPQNANDNVLGTPNVTRAAPVDADFGNPAQVQTIDGKPVAAPPTIAPQQYFLMTPSGSDANNTFAVQKGGTPGTVPAGTPVLTSTNMTYKVKFNAGGTQMQLPNGTNINDGPVTKGQTTGITVVLRRLANPHMPPDPNPASATYNPYVTSDYMTNVALQNTNNGEVSTVKAQPYAGSPATYFGQAAGAKGTTVDTFGQVNNAAGSFSWLVHLDRQLISPMELLHVSGYHPHELTYQFLPKVGWRFGHQADWYTETNRLYRAFEYLTTRDRASGVSPLGGRQPGKININSVWNEEVFRAVADPQNGNGFKTADVQNAFKSLMALRSKGYTPGVGGNVTGQDRPFLGIGTGVMPNTDPIGGVFDDGTPKPNNTGIEDTFLRSGAAGRLFDVPAANHPYRQTELMTKIFNNFTTRSNTFAVWVTVGFFRVPSPTQHVGGAATGPVVVAEEIGAATGTNIRHRIFAVVDRSRLTLDSKPLTTITTPVAAASLNQPLTVAVAAASGTTTFNPQPWAIQAGSILAIDVGTPSEETVVLQQVAGTSVTASFTKAHAAGATVNIPGNPGPPAAGTSWNITAPGFSGATPGFPEGIVLTYTVMQ